MSRRHLHVELDPNQPAFIGVVQGPDGITVGPVDPNGVPGVEYQPYQPVSPVSAVASDALVAFQKRRHASLSQQGLHTPLARGGDYADARPGDFLPRFGPITYANYAAAMQYALRLSPHSRLTTATVQSVAVTPESSSLAAPRTSREKLLLLRESPFARFMPKTDSEKNTAFYLLSHDHTPHDTYDYLERIYHSTLKVQLRQGSMKPMAEARAARAVRSSVYEMGDYYHDAAVSYRQLAELALELKELPNPRAYAREGVIATQALALVVRYRDLKLFILQGKPVGFNPLQRRELRVSGDSDRHKRVADPYRDSSSMPAVARHIDESVDTLTIGDVRHYLPEILADEQRRFAFWQRALSHIKGPSAPLARELIAIDAV